MSARDQKEKELWAAFAVAAMQSYSPTVDIDADGNFEGDLDELIDGMVAVAATFADGMLDAMDERYAGKGGRRPAKTSKRKRREEPDDEDEDLDDEDDD